MLLEIKVLIVEDDATSREMLAVMLEDNGALCTTAINGREAMEVLEFNPDIDIVLLDLHMPVMDGFEVLVQLKSNPYLNDIPVIVLASDHLEKLRTLKLGAADFLAKPYNIEELELRISKLVASRRQAQSATQAKNEFLSLMSHKLRAPTLNIMGLADSLDDGCLGIEQREHIKLMKMKIESLTSTIDDVLNYVQLDNCVSNANVEHFSLRATMQAALESQEDAARGKGIRLALTIAGDVPDRLNGLSAYVHKVFCILIGDALKFSSPGEVLVEITGEPLGEFNSRFCSSVRYQDTGIPVDFSENDFERIVRVGHAGDGIYEGPGLGLAIAQRMVKLMGGTINFKHTEESSSSFNFSFLCNLHGTAELL